MADAEAPVEHDWPGRYYEDFEPGTTYVHGVGRTIEATDNTWFTLLTNNSNEIHFNADIAQHGLYGQRLVNSCLTLSIVTGLSVAGVSRNAAANLAWDNVRLPRPVFAGDTLYARSTCVRKRLSESRPGLGIVEVQTEGYNQHGEVVISFDRRMLVRCRPTGDTAS